ncbi:hypothetical protein IAQ61_000339 [Plenodomus lingam]|uniref:uncharacterized protein n=1 Tax=Leptosphaeria maculans TaxID=5022 RepID=UPI0033186857|nr:hypothetical protein IAQ61_000339 [Plenodomus lingam]
MGRLRGHEDPLRCHFPLWCCVAITHGNGPIQTSRRVAVPLLPARSSFMERVGAYRYLLCIQSSAPPTLPLHWPAPDCVTSPYAARLLNIDFSHSTLTTRHLLLSHRHLQTHGRSTLRIHSTQDIAPPSTASLRSIPEWGHYNIDYDYLKDLIKHQTTPGTNKAVSIPGQGGSSEEAFGNHFLRVLQAQHDRINLFVRSKSGEIERRIQHINKCLEDLQHKRVNYTPGAQLPARLVERYAKIDADVTKTGEEIRSLSRFQVVQRTGFTKILKKYKRWTKDRELSHVFKKEISSQPDSLFQLDLSYLLDQYIDVLDALRSVFDTDGTPAASSDGANGSAARLFKTLEKGEEIDFDVALTTVPLGAKGEKAVYWIHPDHIVEVQVLLLQQMRLYTGSSKVASRVGSSRGPPSRRQSFMNLGIEDDVGLVVLDHAEAFAFKQNTSTIGSSEEAEGIIGVKAAGHIRYVASGKAAVVLSTESNGQGQVSTGLKTAKMERKALQTLLDTPAAASAPERFNDHKEQANRFSKNDYAEIQQWLKDHQSTKPIAGAISKRTRFVGLHNNAAGGTWAALDRDVYLRESLHKDLEQEDWVSQARSQATKFPHAILEVRKEGRQASSLIQTLDRSHLVERVRGFSLEAHAVWACCKPDAMSPPLWIPLLDKDIRKLPEPVRRRSRRTRTTSNSGSQPPASPEATSTSNTSYDGQSSPIASRNGESSATSAQDFVDPPNLQAFRKKSRKPFADYPPPISRTEPEPEPQRYWNEYDHPEDEETGYYIYVDPNASVKFPGQELMEACLRKTRRLFGMRERPARGSFSGDEDASSDDDDDDTVDESPMVTTRNYGTISSHNLRSSSNDGYFSSLFRSLRDPRHDANILQERRSLLSELETHQHKTEMTKLRFYSTSLATAMIIDVILGIMICTSRKKERGVVDLVVLFGTIVTLILCAVGVLSMKTRRERLGWVHQGVVLFIAAGVVALDVVLLLWVLRV